MGYWAQSVLPKWVERPLGSPLQGYLAAYRPHWQHTCQLHNLYALNGNVDVAMEDTQSPAIFLNICQDYLRTIVSEYFTLSVLNQLTEKQANRTAEILEQAEHDPLLSFLLDEADHAIGHLLNLIDVEETREEQVMLRRSIDRNWINWSVTRARVKNDLSIPQYTLKQAQASLKEQGLYQAEIDGVCGEKTKEAFQQLEAKFHQHLRNNGLLSQGTQNIETHEAIKLVKEKGIDGEISDDADLLSLAPSYLFVDFD